MQCPSHHFCLGFSNIPVPSRSSLIHRRFESLRGYKSGHKHTWWLVCDYKFQGLSQVIFFATPRGMKSVFLFHPYTEQVHTWVLSLLRESLIQISTWAGPVNTQVHIIWQMLSRWKWASLLCFPPCVPAFTQSLIKALFNFSVAQEVFCTVCYIVFSDVGHKFFFEED